MRKSICTSIAIKLPEAIYMSIFAIPVSHIASVVLAESDVEGSKIRL
jgi:hypothetical protein